jgi:hypothetical protein
MRTSRSGLGGLALVAAFAAALAACASKHADPVEAQRTKDEEFLAANAESLFHQNPQGWIAVQGGDAAGAGPSADDAAHSAEAVAAPGTLHRFVFRKDDAGERLYRLAFVPEGGLVAGRGFLASLGFKVVSAGKTGPARQLVLDRYGAPWKFDLAAAPRLRVELGRLGSAPEMPFDVSLDPDFDGGLLLPDAAAAALDLPRAEIPGRAEVQVALSRPFEARRSWVSAFLPDLGVSGVVEVLVEAPGPGTKR